MVASPWAQTISSASDTRNNVAAVALHSKHGFEIEGTCKRYAFRDGQYVDVHIMARIKQT